MRLHLRNHELRHLGNIFGDRLILFCRAKRYVRYSAASLNPWFMKWINSIFSSSRRARRICLSESLLQERKRELEQDDLELRIFNLLSAVEDEGDELSCFLYQAHNSIELPRCLRSFRSSRWRRERLDLNSSSEVVPAEAEDGTISRWRNLLRNWVLFFELFFDRVDDALLEKGSDKRNKAWVVDDLLYQCLYKGVWSWSTVQALIERFFQDSTVDHLCD